MNRRLARALATGLVATTALGLGVAPAHAAVYNHDDAVGDVRGQSFDEEKTSPRAQERAADITELRVRHGKHRLIMRLETVDLTRRGSFLLGPAFFIRTADRRYTVQTAAISSGRMHGRLVSLERGSGREVRCQGLFADFDFAGDVSMISVPRRCLGDPRRVTMKAAMLKISPRFDDVVLDSAMNDGRVFPLGETPNIRSAGVWVRRAR